MFVEAVKVAAGFSELGIEAVSAPATVAKVIGAEFESIILTSSLCWTKSFSLVSGEAVPMFVKVELIMKFKSRGDNPSSFMSYKSVPIVES